MKILKTPTEYLDHYYSIYKIPFRLQHWSVKPEPWTNYKTEDYDDYIRIYKYVNHREILPDEVVLDLDIDGDVPDSEKKLKTKLLGIKMCDKLRKEGYTFTFWNSGGNGWHVHLFFPELLTHNKSHRQLIKKLITKHIGHGYLHVPEGEAHICQGNPVLIQLEKALHRKGGIKTIEDYHDNGDNKIPKEVLALFEEKKADFGNKKLYDLSVDVPKAIQLLENEDFANVKDGRTRALFVLACYYSNTMDERQLWVKLDKWNRYQLRGYLQDKQIRATIRSVTHSRKTRKMPLFPYNYLRDLLDELQLECDYSDLSFTSKEQQKA